MGRPKKNAGTDSASETNNDVKDIGAPIGREIAETEGPYYDILELLELLVSSLYEITGDLARLKPIIDKIEQMKKEV